MFPVIGLILAWLSFILNPLFIKILGMHGASLSVLMGLIAVVLIRSDKSQLHYIWQAFPSLFWPNDFSHPKTIKKLINWNQMVRKTGPLGLETVLEEEQDEYLNLGLQYIIDSANEDILRRGLSVASKTRIMKWQRLVNLFEYMARSAIGVGLCFTLLGIIDIIRTPNLASIEVAQIAAAIAALAYGLGLSFFFLYPLAARLETKVAQRIRFDEMALDGFIAITDQENARVMAHRLQEYSD
ncbi:MotA/TolQ/ExbB proton channel family protein [Reinekea sp.]|jgi:chemotaxis protein MotA|uniref:MotA/TolQ/ExbB proton channel family protein n=1 Tax=Reinekea sp. TaxID=1970455 RepID=UPI00398907A1